MNRPLGDSEAPAVGQQVITACAFIHREIDGVDKILMAKRSDTKKFLPSVYEIPGGHIEFGEDVPDGLIREIKEELGVSIKLGDPFAVFTYHNEVKGSHSIEVIYFATIVDPLEHITIDPKVHSTYGWFSQEELPQTFVSEKDQEDDEVKALYRGFALLKGESLKF